MGFGIKGATATQQREAGRALINNVKLFSHLANLGDVRSLVIHPASTTHSQLTDEAKIAAGAGPDVVAPHPETLGQEVARHGQAHGAQPDEADGLHGAGIS